MSDNDTQLNEVRQMTAEVLGAMRALAALPDAFSCTRSGSIARANNTELNLVRGLLVDWRVSRNARHR